MFPLLAILPMTVPQPVAQPFPLSDIKVTGGPFATAHRVLADYLLEIEPDRLLASFREHSGLKAKAKKYAGWEDSGLAGHTLGHYLTACAQEYAQTGDKRFKAKVDTIVDELVECQKSRPDGYISAIPDGDKKWAEVRAGDIKSGGFDLNGMWSPWYTHHKVFAGLLDAQALAGNKKALGVAERFADWAIDLTKGLNDEQWQRMLNCEYGGMNESLAELYARTKKVKYLALARKFYDRRVLDPLAEGKDELANKHSNTQIPKLVGLARLYEITGEEKDRRSAEFFWDRVVNHHSYVIGGNSNGEYLGAPDHLRDRLSSNTAETCNTYNMLRLTRHVFAWKPDAAQMDFYERAYLNHILGSQDPATAGMTYFMPLASGAHREHSGKWDNFTCCHGSGMENHTKHGDSAYFHDGSRTLWVNLFMPTELNWRAAGVKLRQETAFPESNAVSLTVLPGSKPKEFEMRLRHPGWAKGEIDFRVNGQSLAKSSSPGSYVAIKRRWMAGDKLEFALPMALRTEAMPDDPKRVAVLYGPVVLAADLGPEKSPWPRVPVLVADGAQPASWLEPVSGKPLTFRTKGGAGRPDELTFRPFSSLHHERYATYFDEFTEAQWATAEAEYRAEEVRQRDLEARTVDAMRIGEMQPERDHNLTSEKNDVREANGRSFRTAMNGGWTEFDMKVDAAKASELVLTYWGNERLRPDFTILVDGKEIVAEKLEGRPLNRFFDVAYAIPDALTKGKEKVRVRIQPREGKWSASFAGARVVRS
ncbi:glycoside hydrolase family 127 protein [bacterium]|nr:MAG: glycoside hydrolase family 127 protein [bacterium]